MLTCIIQLRGYHGISIQTSYLQQLRPNILGEIDQTRNEDLLRSI